VSSLIGDPEDKSLLGKIFKSSNVLNSFGLIGILGLMILPVPPSFLDVLLTFNVTFALVILLVTIYVREPLEFSVFPSLLLVVTLFRLALNVASTRLILSEAYAGEVISSFGGFVVKGNYVIGMVIFLIIVVIQFIVITKGAGRIAEVAARFTLDAMPGKQMSIDADLNTGLITEDEARERRGKISREADFYGAMDGASKFVRGDAIAGIVITLINIIGGLIIGIVQRGMSASEAAMTYTTLTVGDGLVTQIPALIISTGAGMIVTRTTSESNFGADVTSQIFSYSKVLLIVSISLLGLGFVPGLPILPFFIMGLIFMGFFLLERKANPEKEHKDKEKLQEEQVDPVEQDELYYVDRLEVEIGYGLIPLVNQEMGGDFLKRVTSIRKQAALELGLQIMPIRIRDNLQLKPNQYRIKLKGVDIATDAVHIDRLLAIGAGQTDDSISGLETRDPAFNMPALWISREDADRAEAVGYTVVEPSAVIATHLNEIIHRHADEIMTRQDVKDLVERVRKYAPAVVDDLMPDQINYAFLQQVLSNLLRERVSIRDMVTILETIAYYIGQTKDVDFISERIREALGRSIIDSYLDPQDQLVVITAHPGVEDVFLHAMEESSQKNVVELPPEFTRELLESVGDEVGKVNKMTLQPVVLCSSQIRLAFKRFVEPTYPYLTVVGYSEVGRDVTVKAVGMVKVNETESAQDSGRVA
jgi:flagellar biosynthesis protein FlhA